MPQGMRARIDRIASMGTAERRKRLKRRFWQICGATVLLGVLYLGWLYITLPDISDPRALIADQSSVILDRNGVELYRLSGDEDRTWISGNQIPEHMKQAIIAIEDKRFYDRGCLDIRAILRTIFTFGRGGGASTLTRQLARNALDLNRENILSRKLKEFFLGCALERRYTKEEVLDQYLNWVPFGRNVYGIEQASKAYFSKSATGLTLAESAVLASIPQRPSYFSPYGNHVYTDVTDEALTQILAGQATSVDDLSDDDIRIGLIAADIGTGSTIIHMGGRTNQVLRNMRDMEFITEEEETKALADLQTMTFQPLRESIRAPHFVLWVRQMVDDMLAQEDAEGILDRGGLQIETTLDWTLQQRAENAVQVQAKDLVDRFQAHNVSLVAIAPSTRELLAYVGNTDYADDEHDGKVDMARAARQPGSTFKPFVYAASFREGYGPATILYDVETKFGDDIPQNFDGHFVGITDARHALAGSRNIPAIKAFYTLPQDNREDRILDLVSAMGAPTPKDTKLTLQQAQAKEGIAADKRFSYGYPLAIGAAETPLIEMVQAYATLADGGQARPLIAIKRVLDRRGSILFQAEESRSTEVLDPRIAYEITSILSDVSARPNEYWQTVLTVPGWEAAAKTGTSNKCLERIESGQNKGQCKERRPSDVWTMGYTPAIAAGVWVGNADGTALSQSAESLITAAPIWKNFMVAAHTPPKNTGASAPPSVTAGKPTQFPEPSGIIFPQVSTLSGELPTECTPLERRRADVFLEEFAPVTTDSACAMLEVDRVTKTLASDSCPEEAREQGAYLVPRSILSDRWPLWQKGVEEWAAKQMELWNATPDHSGSLLPLPLAPTKTCDIRETPGRMTKPTAKFEFPEAGSVVPYPAFKPKVNWTSGSAIRETRFELDGKLAATGSGSERIAITVPRSIPESGLHTLKVTVYDMYFNAASDSVTFRFQQDSDPPTVRFTSPNGGAISIPSGTALSLKADAGDGEGALKYVQFYLGTRLLTTKPTAPFELDYSAEIRPGDYELRAVATDMAGNTDEDTVRLTVTP